MLKQSSACSYFAKSRHTDFSFISFIFPSFINKHAAASHRMSLTSWETIVELLHPKVWHQCNKWRLANYLDG